MTSWFYAPTTSTKPFLTGMHAHELDTLRADLARAEATGANATRAMVAAIAEREALRAALGALIKYIHHPVREAHEDCPICEATQVWEDLE